MCIDLTCGLGVDAFHFSRSFDRVIAVERDEVLARVARHNFELLKAHNITVENSSAEAFLSAYTGPTADLMYLDPARRSANERVFLLEECSPNILELLPDLM
ncbi:MAG: RsmD family RNA methyltransferase [Rikenellaceae bacterium]|nr:RsmD family RNA methyltransferase [Rikenellaceae bacterium]